MKKIDVFDFDKTLYKKDSTVSFYLYMLKIDKKITKYLFIQLFSFLKYKLKIIDKVKFKEKFFSFLNSIDDIDRHINNYWKENKKYIIYDLIKNSKNIKVVISASPEFLLSDICSQIGIDMLIASKVDKKTGKFYSDNCYGEEKVNRLNKKIKNYEIDNFYSDSISDIYLAEKANNSYLVKGDKIKIWKS